MQLIKTIIICLVVSTITACSDNSSGESDTEILIIPEIELTPEREGYSVARMWNEVLLAAIRHDFARPTIHARNLFHISSAMYDAWSAYATTATPYLFGKTLGDFQCVAGSFDKPIDSLLKREEAISYASYRLIQHRFALAPGVTNIQESADELMASLGYDTSVEEVDYSTGSAAALGNYIANCYIDYGLQDGSNEEDGYANIYYQPVNRPLSLGSGKFGNPSLFDPNRWQPLAIDNFIDQAGNPIATTPEFLSPEWGQVAAFALSENDKTTYNRGGFDYQVYHDPGQPPMLGGDLSDEYKWGFALVAIWSGQLNEDDGVMIDISPASLGNIESLPTNFEDYRAFYNLSDGGDTSRGYSVNPVTGLPYQEQLVPRGDYGRVLAEFWADGPDSETPPGHWFVLLNSVSDHSELVKRFAGQGDTLGNLEWDIKTYFTLGGTMHDSAIAAWGIKGWYDYIRPVSAIRGMAEFGQSTDATAPSYNVKGIPLVSGSIELVNSGDPLAGANNENVGKIKIYAWRGPDFILPDSETGKAGVDWILAGNWWPYQRPTFVTPPFAGYVSGHSTYSRAAAEIMTAMTGDAYFPGGMSGFEIKANDFLVFEEGPSVDMVLQWATYRDASDQCSLSRIWGGIHPPADDIPGRLIGDKIGVSSFEHARSYFSGTVME